jgi:hypothetical protein
MTCLSRVAAAEVRQDIAPDADAPALENNEHKMEVCTEKERQPPHCWNVPIAFETAQHGTFMRLHDALDAVGIPNGQLWRD